MARQPRDFRLQTRDARRKLAARHEPYWHELRRGLHLGYRKGGGGGVWWQREFRNGRYAKRRLGLADDELDADATAVLSWSEALTMALGEQRPTAHAPTPYTVSEALDDYFAHRTAKSPSLSVDTDRSKAKAVIVPKLGEKKVAALTARELLRWRDGLVQANEDREAMRRAQATANRNWTVLRAALNHAYATGKVPLDQAWLAQH